MRIQRTKNAIYGSVWGIINRVICTIFPFIIRTIIIRKLGIDYVGLNSLFTAVLQILNLSELGISSAIVYNMYKPISEDDMNKIFALVVLYKKVYRIIGGVILCIGLILMPFINFFIKGDVPADINVRLLFLLFLANTCISYLLFGYTEAILSAYQRADKINIVRTVTYTAQFIVQIVVLLFFDNYYLYVFIMLLSTIARGFLNKCFSDEILQAGKYENCKDQFNDEKEFIAEIKNDLLKGMWGVTLGRLCTISRETFDQVVISIYLGLSTLALFDNYYYVLSSIFAVMNIVENSVLAGIGNSLVVETEEKNYNDFKKINFMFMFVSIWITTGLCCLYQPFMRIWVGEKLLLSNEVRNWFCVYFFARCIATTPSIYNTAGGQWWKLRFEAITEAAMNLALNIILVRIFGISGILIATSITFIVCTFCWGARILYGNVFKAESYKELIFDQLKNTLIALFVTIITYSLCQLIRFGNQFLQFVIDLLICALVPGSILSLIHLKNRYFKQSVSLVKSIVKSQF